MRPLPQDDLFAAVESQPVIALAELLPAAPKTEKVIHVVAGHREISEAACDILAGMEIVPGKAADTFLAKLTCGQTKHYKQIDEVLKRIGGKWAGNKKAHVFGFDPTEVIAAIAEGGFMPEVNPLAYFPTPRAVIDKIFADDEVMEHLAYLERDGEGRVLEPSAGTGAFVKYLLEKFPGLKGRIDCVEPDPLKCKILTKLGAGQVFQARYEEWTPSTRYGAVVMNPPFSVQGDKMAYITHIEKALTEMSGHFGMVVAIAPTGFLAHETRREVGFRNLIAENGIILILPKGDFKESGTSIETAALTLFTAAGPNWRNESYQDYLSFHSFTIGVSAVNEGDLHARMEEVGELILDCAGDFREDEVIMGQIDSLIAMAAKRVWQEGGVLTSMRPEIKDGIRLDLADTALSIARDLRPVAA